MVRRSIAATTLLLATALIPTLCIAPGVTAQEASPLRIFISADMEGIGGIGTGRMTSANGGKDYAVGRQLMTDEVNTVIEAIWERGPADIWVNDSHGDHQNLLHTQLPEGVQYIQGSIKTYGMVEGLDETFDAAIFLGYHTRAGTTGGFLAHTGSGSVKGLWLNGVEVGEGGMNAYFAGSKGVPVIMASGDSAFAAQFKALTGATTVSTKVAVNSAVARLDHPDVVRRRLREATLDALDNLERSTPVNADGPVTVRMRFASLTRPDILQAIPGMRRVDGFTIEYDAADMATAYGMIRLMYRFVSW